MYNRLIFKKITSNKAAWLCALKIDSNFDVVR